MEELLAGAIAALFAALQGLWWYALKDCQRQRDLAVEELKQQNKTLAELAAFVKSLPGGKA